jgi:hypothetical protein
MVTAIRELVRTTEITNAGIRTDPSEAATRAPGIDPPNVPYPDHTKIGPGKAKAA